MTSRCQTMNEHGISIIEVLIATGIMMVIMLGMTSMFGFSVSSQLYLDQKDDARAIQNDIAAILSQKDLCTVTLSGLNRSAIRGNNRVYGFTRVRGNGPGNPTIYRAGVAMPDHRVEIESMEVANYDEQPPVAGERYQGQADVHIRYRKRAPSLGGDFKPKALKIYLEFRRTAGNGGPDSGNNGQLENCATQRSAALPVVETAIVRRSGIVLSARGCLVPYTPEDYDGSVDPSSSSCNDADGNGICNNLTPDGRRLSTRPHPYVDPAKTPSPQNQAFWDKTMRRIDPYPNVMGVPEGRCPVQVKSIPADVNPPDVFAIYDSDKTYGVGCRVTAGWTLASCQSNNDGLGGDADMDVRIVSGTPYCVTNDITQAHMDGVPWNVRMVGMTVVCMRIRDPSQ